MAKKKEKKNIEELLEEALIPKDEQPYEIPSNWEWVRLGSVSQIKGGKRLPQGEKILDERTEFPYLRVTDFEKYNINILNLKYISEEVAKTIKNYTISENDVYISIAGTIGRVGIIQPELEGANLTENAAKITNFFVFNKWYLCYLISSPQIQEIVNNSTVSTGQPKLALFRIAEFTLPLPPLSEQTRIVNKLESMLSKLKEAKEKIAEAKESFELRRASILHKAFTGELTVQWREEKAVNSEELTVNSLLEKINEEKIKNWEEECRKAELEGKKKPSKPKLKTVEEMKISDDEKPYDLPHGCRLCHNFKK